MLTTRKPPSDRIPGEGGPRSASTREAILESARGVFAAKGYDAAGLREIASGASASAALAIRYFGSKEGLFAAAIVESFDLGPLLAGPRECAGAGFAAYVAAKAGDPRRLAPIMAMLRSVGSPVAGPMLSRALETSFVEPLADWLGGEEARARAGLVASLVLGECLRRFVLSSGGDEDGELLAGQIQALFDE